jgi:uncharacterized protein
LRALLWASLLALGGVAQAQTPLAVPPLSARVIDQAQALKADERQALEDRLAGYEQAHGTQIVVLMVPSTNGEPIEDFANRVGSTWKIGRKGVGDGLLILLAVNDKRSRIEVARALEGAVPDLAAKRILRETMGPRFAKGDFAGGLNAGLDQITKLLEGESLPPLRGTQQSQKAPAADNNDIESLLVMLLIGVIVGGSVLKSMFGRGLGALLSGGAAGVITWFVVNSIIFGGIAGVVAFIFVLIMGSSGSGGRGYGGPVIWGGGGGGRSSGGGGGFSSGGGGDFAGGGASDSWGGND